MHFIKERIGKMLEYLQDRIYPESAPVSDFRMIRSSERFTDIEHLDTSAWKPFRRGEIWGGDREYYWFETILTIPEEFDGKCVVYEVKTGAEGGWDATNPQFSIFVDGKRIQGLDVNHREIVLTEKAEAGRSYRVILSAYTGDGNFHLFLDTAMKVLDRATEKYCYDLAVPYDTARLLDPEDGDYIRIIQALNDSLNLLDMREEGSEAYYASLERAQAYITEEFYDKYCGKDDAPLVCCVGHTHIDCAWLWTLSVTRDKAVRSFSTVLELMRRYPEYIFMSSQPQLYEYVKENAPDVYEGIKQRVKEGRWEVEGGMWVEADCNLASGEALSRQFLYGKRFFRKEFGKDNQILWLPDVFGYSAALPQIMKLSGIRYFMTTKISWNETNKMPYDTFLWEGIDGTRTLTHFIPTRDYHKAAVENGTETEHFTTYNGYLNPSQMKGAWARYSNKDLNREVLCSYGFGDGGGGPTSEQLENQRRMSRGIPGLPVTRPSTALDFFKKLEADTKDSKYLPAWVGELYLEYHRGTYTTMARNKRFNRKAELAYQNEETYAVLDSLLTGADSPDRELHEAWIVILRNQFHDILPGSAIKEVYEDSKAEYEKIFALNQTLQNRSLGDIASQVKAADGDVVIFNPNSVSKAGLVTFRMPDNGMAGDAEGTVFRLEAQDGRLFAVQKTEDGWLSYVNHVPQKGYEVFKVIRADRKARNQAEYHSDPADSHTDEQAGKGVGFSGKHASRQPEEKSCLYVSSTRMENDFFRIEFNDKGQFAHLYDKRAKREILKDGKPGNVIVSYEDRPHNYDAWDINNYYTEKSWEVDQLESLRVVETGPVRATVRIERKYLESTIVQYISIYRDLDRIDIRNEIDWKQHLIMLKDHFPVDVHASTATFDIQYGNVTRSTTDNTSWDWSKFEVCHHKWLDVGEDGYGVSFLNDCKFGVSVRGTDVGLTMLKSPLYPNPDADKEHHTFTYSIFPHQGDWREAGTVAQAYELNNPMKAVTREAGSGSLPDTFSLFSVDQENVVIEAVKKAEDSDAVIVRMYECWNRRSDVTLTAGAKIQSASFCNIMEEEDQTAATDGRQIHFRIRPYQIVTLKIRFGKEHR